MKNGEICLDTEDCGEYYIDDVSTTELLGVCDFIEDYCIEHPEPSEKEKLIMSVKEKVASNDNHIDMSDKNIILFDVDTEKKAGESCKVLSLKMDEEDYLYVEVEYYGTEEWDINDLTNYEIKLILEELW